MDYKKKIDYLRNNLKNFKILIMGLPGSGKTTLAQKLSLSINAKHLNADEIRKKYNDWDFSVAGRNRQSKRMKDLSIKLLKDYKIVLADFICPLPKTRKDFNNGITRFRENYTCSETFVFNKCKTFKC